jgi:hypothetical protein
MAAAERRGRREHEQPIVELSEKHAAHGLLRAELYAGDIAEPEYLRRRDRVYQAVTPRDLWKATAGRAGSKRRSDWRAIRKSIALQLAIIVFAALAMLLILWGTIVYWHPSAA